MFGDAVPIRFSKRIHRKSSLSSIKVSSKKNVRRPAVKKRTHGINSSLLKATEKTKVSRKSKFKQTSNPESIQQESRKKVDKTCKQKRTTKTFLNVSQISLPINEVSSQNHFLESSDEKKNCKKLVGKITSDRQNLRVLKLFKSSKEKGRSKELSHCDIKSSKERKHSQKKSVIRVTNSSSKSVLTQNPENFTYISKHSDRKKSARLKCSEIKKSAGLSQEPIPTMVSKSVTVTPVIKKVPCTSRHSENRKSARLSKESNKLRIADSKISPCTHSFQSILETPHPEKHSGRRKSSRLLEPSPLNKELSFSTRASLSRMNSNSTIKKISKSSKSAELLSYKNCSRKRGRPEVSNEEIPTISHEKLKPKRRRQVSQHRKISGNLKKPLSNETENLPLDVLATPAFKPIRIKTLSKVCNEDIPANSHEKLKPKRRRQVSQHKKNSENLKKPLSNETENLPLDILATPAFKPLRIRNLSKNYSSKSNPESSKTPFDILTTSAFKSSRTLSKSYPKSSKANSKVSSSKIHIISEDLQDTRKKKSAGDNVCVDNSASSSKYRSMQKSMCPVKTDVTKLKNSQNSDGSLMPGLTIQNNVDNFCIKKSKKSIGKKVRKKLVEMYFTETKNNIEVNLSSSLPIKEDCLTDNLYGTKHRRAKSVPSAYREQRSIKTLAPVWFTQNTGSNLSVSTVQDISQLPIDNLTYDENASCSQNDDERRVINILSPFTDKKKIISWSLGHELCSKISAKDGLKDIPGKGTLKRKRWLLNNLKEKNECYEDDLYENHSFNHNKSFHFGDESDGSSSVNIATPKFECILTPALPKKTPRFKDCISPTELLQARKTAEEYLYRRNKKRKSGDGPSSSGKKTDMNKKKTVQDIPEKKKLDFEEAVNKLIEVQKNLESNAEVNDEEEDSYFSDASN
ncbi:uncharacterized protein LOC129961929 isoform X2 [Argiope bruennichi]|uniref:uncharacterized protein LOC129961929 isoform X2 n=1 Tax=Argiope bruennichi TaxID=94029 RepID=UPI002494F155|nr:uncharacterized protein LOC129961929 isoform X2 [Argiope bruennichi]